MVPSITFGHGKARGKASALTPHLRKRQVVEVRSHPIQSSNPAGEYPNTMAELTRRRFLGRSVSAAAAAAALAGHAAPIRRVGANDRIRVGLIGCRGIGMTHTRLWLANPEVDIVAICDVDDAAAANSFQYISETRDFTPGVYKDFRRVIDRDDIDAIIVATPDHWHALPTVYGCQADKDVYVEKPLGQCIDEGRAIVEAAKRHDRVVQMGTQWRSGAHFRDAIEFVHSGQLGTIRQVRAWAYLDWALPPEGIGSPADADPPEGVDYDMWLGPAPLRPFNPNRFHFNFRWFWDYAGGLMTDWGVHLINLALWGMGPEMPLRVSSVGGKRVLEDNSDTPDTQIAVYDFPSYTLVWEHQLQSDLGPHGRPHGVLFSGSKGTLQLWSDGWEVTPEPKFGDFEAATHRGDGATHGAHVRNFLDCMHTREKPVQHPELAHHVSTVAALGNIALRSGREIHWDAANEVITDDPEADALVARPYRKPWTLPYSRRLA